MATRPPLPTLTVPATQIEVEQTADDFDWPDPNKAILAPRSLNVRLQGIQLLERFTIHAIELREGERVIYCFPDIQPDGRARLGICPEHKDKYDYSLLGAVWIEKMKA